MQPKDPEVHLSDLSVISTHCSHQLSMLQWNL